MSHVKKKGFTGLKLQLPLAIITVTEPPPPTLEVVTVFLHQDKLQRQETNERRFQREAEMCPAASAYYFWQIPGSFSGGFVPPLPELWCRVGFGARRNERGW